MVTFSRHLAVLGTASDVGKSTLVAALCRILRRRGVSVQPFKAQNMSNNAAVTPDGGEIGRAQYLQALAAGVAASVHHNPVLLKPSADNRSQVVVHGKVLGDRDAASYFGDTTFLREAAQQSLELLTRGNQCLVIEGAGSCAEVNLRSREFVNFPIAHATRANVILLADIDRGGVFAQLIGSLEVMPAEDRARVRGLLINRFRGDRSLFDDGVRYLEAKSGLPVLGVVPHLYGLDLDAEDALGERKLDPAKRALEPGKLRIGVLRLPHIANFTDFDALARVPDVEVHYLYRNTTLGPDRLSGYSGVILPGSKSVINDRLWLKETGWDKTLRQYHERGGHLLGVCGGFQILGESIEDPTASESSLTVCEGLGLLKVKTRFAEHKTLRQVCGETLKESTPVLGYEIHLGQTETADHAPLFRLRDLAQGEFPSDPTLPRNDGVRDDERRIWGTYLHGLFDQPGFTELYLKTLDASFVFRNYTSARQHLEQELERLADHVEAHMDIQTVLGWIRQAGC